MNSKVLIAQSFLAIALLASFASSEHVFWKTFREMHRGLKVEPSSTRDAALVEEKWITQKVDHFNEEDTRTWQMRYLENAEQYESGGPLFILVAGEWSVTTDVMTGGHIYGMVKEHKGLYFYAEHRFYGKSQPMSDFTTESLKYLDMKQILADLAHFITTIKATYPGASNSKVFLAGGSYSAAVVAWFKHDYPELADAVWSSSTPIITKFNFVEYKEYEGESIRRVGGEQCYNAIDNATRTYEQMFRENRGAEVRAMLKICNDFDETNELDYYSFFSTISSVFSNIVQTQNPQNGNIQAACRAITSHETPAVGLAKFLLYIWTRIGSLQTCNQMSYASMVRGLSSTKLSMDISRPWFYQLCSQCGWFQTSGNRNQPYGIFPEELYLNLCADVYGSHLTRDYIYKAIGEMSAHYGDENIKADHVYYTNGDVDAIVAMSIKDPAKMTLLPGYSHCSDFESISSRDTPEMVASKQKIAQLVREWFAE